MENNRQGFQLSLGPLMAKLSIFSSSGIIFAVLLVLTKRWLLHQLPFDGNELPAITGQILTWWIIIITAVVFAISLLAARCIRRTKLIALDEKGLRGTSLFDTSIILAWADMGTPRHRRFLNHDYLLVPAASGRPTIWLQAPIHQSEDFRAAVRKFAPLNNPLFLALDD